MEKLNKDYNKILKKLQKWELNIISTNNTIPVNTNYKQMFSEKMVKHCIQVQHNYNRWLGKEIPENLSEEYLEKEYNNMTAIERDEIVFSTY